VLIITIACIGFWTYEKLITYAILALIAVFYSSKIANYIIFLVMQFFVKTVMFLTLLFFIYLFFRKHPHSWGKFQEYLASIWKTDSSHNPNNIPSAVVRVINFARLNLVWFESNFPLAKTSCTSLYNKIDQKRREYENETVRGIIEYLIK